MTYLKLDNLTETGRIDISIVGNLLIDDFDPDNEIQAMLLPLRNLKQNSFSLS